MLFQDVVYKKGEPCVATQLPFIDRVSIIYFFAFSAFAIIFSAFTTALS